MARTAVTSALALAGVGFVHVDPEGLWRRLIDYVDGSNATAKGAKHQDLEFIQAHVIFRHGEICDVCVLLHTYIHACCTHTHSPLTNMYTHLLQTHKYTRLHTDEDICIYICIYIYMYLYKYIYIYIHTYMYTHTHIYIHIAVLPDHLCMQI
jgi:hypothetical protein